MKNYTLSVRLLALVLLVLTGTLTRAQLTAKSLTAANGVQIGFYEYLPKDYNKNTKYPLIIFLHGLGERGNGTTELNLVKKHGIPKNIDKGHPMRFYWNGKWETFLVLAPQLSASYGSWQRFYTEEMLKYAKANLSVDEDRIFLTGLSLGGGGTWSFVSSNDANASQLAGIAVVCGTCNLSNASYLVNNNIPVWAFHAENDGTVSVNCTHNAIKSINALNPKVEPIKTIWPTGGHGIWDEAYDTTYKYQNPNVYEWFLGQNRKLAPNVLPVANAGNDITVAPNQIATLNGSASKDSDGKIVRYIWTYISGPVKPTIGNVNGASTTVTGLSKEGSYAIELKVVDDRAGWTTDTVIINVANGTPPAENKAPVANAGSDVTIYLPQNSAQLDGSKSSDDKGIEVYQWTIKSGPAGAVITGANTAKPTVSGLVAGVYVIELEVKDKEGLSAKATVKITVVATENIPPTANAGSDQTIKLPRDNVRLNGSKSTDADGTIVKYRWTMVSSTGNYQIAWPDSASTPFRHLEVGKYVVELRVTDNNGASSTDTVIITVLPADPENANPIAKAGSDIIITLPTNTATLDGSDSYDPDGNIVSYSWKKISGPASGTIQSPSQSVTKVTNLVEGNYSFSLTVTDDQGAVHSDTVNVKVNPKPNTLPVANAGADKEIRLPINKVTLDGSASYDPDGNIVSYTWSKISGPAAFNIQSPSAAKTDVTGLVQGVYVFRLTVKDDRNGTRTDDVQVTVLEAINIPPVANVGSNIEIRLPKNNVTADGSKSSDSDGSITNYQWTKISGPAMFEIVTPFAAKTEIKNLVAGTYVFRLTVTDNKGAKSSADLQVKVLPAMNQPPVAVAGKDTSIVFPEGSYMLDGSASYDPDGVIIKYQWKQLDGSGAVHIDQPDEKISTLSNIQPGYYLFVLTVTDNNQATATDTIRLTVTSNLKLTNENEVKLYPNPSNGKVTVYHSGAYTGTLFVRMYNMNGVMVGTEMFNKDGLTKEMDMDISKMPRGTYLIELTGSNFRKTLKVVKQ